MHARRARDHGTVDLFIPTPTFSLKFEGRSV